MTHKQNKAVKTPAKNSQIGLILNGKAGESAKNIYFVGTQYVKQNPRSMFSFW